MSGLQEIAAALAGELVPERLARQVAEHVRRVLKVDHAAVYVWEADAEAFLALADTDVPSDAPSPSQRPGEGVVGLAFSHAQPVLVDDYPSWPHAVPAMVERGVRSVAAVPLAADKRALGVLVVESLSLRRFTPPDVQALSLFAALVAPTLEIARLHAQSEWRRVAAEALAEIARRGVEQRNPESIVSFVCEQARKIVGSDYAAVALFEEDGSLAWHGISGQRSEAWRKAGFANGKGATSQAVFTGQTVIVERLPERADFSRENAPLHWAEGGRTVLATPLRGQNVVGALVLAWRTDVRPRGRDVLLTEALATHTAVILENARARTSERRLAEEAEQRARQLARSESELRILYEALACGVLVRDATGLITHVNPTGAAILGLSLDQMQGYRPTDLWLTVDESGQPLPEARHAFTLARLSRRPAMHQLLHIIRPDGEHRWLDANAVPVLDERGEVTQVVNSFVDVTERVVAEAEVRKLNAELERRVAERTAELEAAVKELEAFSYSVSHDLRAPLRAMDGFSRILLEDYAAQLEPEAQRYLRLVRENAQHMGELISDLLTFSRLSRQPLKLVLVDPAEITRQAFDELLSERERQRTHLHVGPMPRCRADTSLMRQVFVNLLSNALKFTREREQVSIEIGSFQQDGRPVYFVRDNGVGFDMRYAHKLFGVFQRLHRMEDYEGTGVGLALVQRIVHRHGGQIWAEAEPGRGATFYFSLGDAAHAE